MELIKTPGEFLEKMDEFKIQSTLIGNGFCLSHPELSNCFQWDIPQKMRDLWHEILPLTPCTCPESFLSQIRLNVSKQILKSYIDNLMAKHNAEPKLSGFYSTYNNSKNWNCSRFLNKMRGPIFTLNYDPLFYFEVLSLLKKQYYVDGFQGKQFLNQASIEKWLRSCEIKSKIYFLHGAWFIQANRADKLRKLSFSAQSNDTIDSLFEEGMRPFLILEDRSSMKEIQIKSDPYFKFCLEQLRKLEGNILIFGCSFEKDDHILDVLAEKLANQKGSVVYITYLEDQESNKKKIRTKIEKYRDQNVKARFVLMPISSNVIWEYGRES